MIDPDVVSHLQATLKMLTERHGPDAKFTLIARFEDEAHQATPDNPMANLYYVGNDKEMGLVHTVLTQLLDTGRISRSASEDAPPKNGVYRGSVPGAKSVGD